MFTQAARVINPGLFPSLFTLIQQFIFTTDYTDEHGSRGLLMTRRPAAIHPQGEGTVVYNTLVCNNLRNLWVRQHFPGLRVRARRSADQQLRGYSTRAVRSLAPGNIREGGRPLG